MRWVLVVAVLAVGCDSGEEVNNSMKQAVGFLGEYWGLFLAVAVGISVLSFFQGAADVQPQAGKLRGRENRGRRDNAVEITQWAEAKKRRMRGYADEKDEPRD